MMRKPKITKSASRRALPVRRRKTAKEACAQPTSIQPSADNRPTLKLGAGEVAESALRVTQALHERNWSAALKALSTAEAQFAFSKSNGEWEFCVARCLAEQGRFRDARQFLDGIPPRDAERLGIDFFRAFLTMLLASDPRPFLRMAKRYESPPKIRSKKAAATHAYRTELIARASRLFHAWNLAISKELAPPRELFLDASRLYQNAGMKHESLMCEIQSLPQETGSESGMSPSGAGESQELGSRTQAKSSEEQRILRACHNAKDSSAANLIKRRIAASLVKSALRGKLAKEELRKLIESVIADCDQRENPLAQAEFRMAIGRAMFEAGADPLALLRKARDIFAAEDHMIGLFDVDALIGQVLTAKQELESAAICHWENIAIAKKMGFVIGEVSARIALIEGLLRRRETTSAQRELSLLDERLNSTVLQAFYGLAAAGIHQTLGNLNRAERWAHLAYSASRAIREPRLISQSAAFLGSILSTQQDYTSAERYIQQAIRLDRKQGDINAELDKIQSLALIRVQQARGVDKGLSANSTLILDDAQKLCNEALHGVETSIHDLRERHRLSGGLEQALGQISLVQGDLRLALRQFGSARARFEQARLDIQRAHTDAMIGLVLRLLSQHGQPALLQEAWWHFQSARDTFRLAALPAMEQQMELYLADLTPSAKTADHERLDLH